MTRPFRSPPAPVTLSNCEREPIHVPGTIQPDGVLLAACASDGRITHASANLASLLGLEADLALGRTLREVLGPAADEAIRAAVASERYAPANALEFRLASHPDLPCLALAHESQGLTVVEIELACAEVARSPALARAQGVVQALRRAERLDELFDIAARELKRLTGYDRVMVYRFDAEGHGEVVAEAREDGQEPFLHLRYPASDIPDQARRLYVQARVRVIGDVGYLPVPVLSKDDEPLDMTFCALRSVSPMHLQYLRNMGVGATLGVSLVLEGTLWGMLVCHHRTPRRPSLEIRALCDLVGQVMSLLIRSRGDLEVLAGRSAREQLLAALSDRMLRALAIGPALAEAPEDLLRLVEADGALLRLGGQVQLFGRTPSLPEAVRLLAALRGPAGDEVLALDALGGTLPEFDHLAATASGVLVLPIPNNPGDALLWFRSELVRSVTWGGNPDKAVERDPLTGDLSPRRSFEAWRQLLRGRSAPWSPVDLQSAADLRRALTDALLRQAEARLAHLSHHDPLTGLPNRRFVEERLAVLPRAEGPMSLIFVDLDRFKSVNDSLGHVLGDSLLEQVAQRLEEVAGPANPVARLGGDEFVVLCEGMEAEAAEALATRLLQALRPPFPLGGKPYFLTASLGVASTDGPGREALLNSADVAMYAAKRQGGNLVVRFEGQLHAALRRRIEIGQDLFTALERGELSLRFQPILRVPDRNLLGLEALLRWRHPRLGPLSPAEFIPLAEEASLIVPIGAWVLQEALARLRLWREARPDLYVSVNVSGVQVARPDFATVVQGALAAAGLPPGALVLEVTESVLMQEEAVRHLGEARALGVRVAIDDFGTGYSSLAYLRRLPVDKLKTDRSFLAQIGQDPAMGALFGAIVRLAHTLELEVVAEGVEEPAQWHYLRALDGDAAQGFWLSEPLDPDQVAALIEGLGSPPAQSS
jgi:diguanylate cyclase (GGDEF)-like protein